MPFLIIFGLIVLTIGLTQRYIFGLKWEIDENACNIEREKHEVKSNKISFYSLVIGGSLLLIIGLIGVFVFDMC